MNLRGVVYDFGLVWGLGLLTHKTYNLNPLKMKKILFATFLLLQTLLCVAQKLQSPDQYLGYTLGSHFTPHYKIVNYAKAVAAANPDMVKLEKYGETNEGRELLLLFVSAPQNIQHLEEIRINNTRLAGTANDKQAGSIAKSPAIVWLSYNVHGNEPSSSEAAMLTLYSLVNADNAKTKEWLKNTVVIIDPCLNPDGRDRYVQWYNSMVGKNANADPQTREHNEPWPGGRSNHYNFDLNRDWAWQTQIETQQRMKVYSKWLPQVHVDFHEQGYNEPYYFAPAAQPFHEVITPWQKEFQEYIGKNNAKYFDEKGWLYFTKERFDLFYPSYGDTYPLYNGAIGMTYEQGGHSRGGLTVQTNSGDTLTLTDRIQHHYTTGLSTVEVASQNAEKLVSEFATFYNESKAGKDATYKTYILTDDNWDKINGIAKLLENNGIAYSSVNNANFKGFHYATKKEEKGQLKKYNIAVSAAQPHGKLAKVLLEPQSVLVDSNTYDITAWSIPYSHNVEAYAVKEELPLIAFAKQNTLQPLAASAYGYLVKYQSLNSVKLLAYLLKQGVKVRYNEKPFTYNATLYDRGTLILLQKGNNQNLQTLLKDFAAGTPIDAVAVSTGFMEKGPDFGSPDIRFIKSPSIAVLTGDDISSLAAGEIWHLFDQQLSYPVSLLNANDLAYANLKNYTVLIMPDGRYSNLNDKNIQQKLKDFLSKGGNIIAMENAVKELSTCDWGIKLRENKEDEKDKDKPDYSLLKRYENRERDDLSNYIPGAIYTVQLDNSHPLAYGYADTYFTLKQDNRVFEFLKDGWNVGYIKKDNYVTGFAGSKLKPKLVDGLVFGVLEMNGGNVVLLADNPLFRQFWEAGKLLFCNAVFLVGQ